MGKDASKKIVLVLNKVDLVPKEAARQWLAALRREFPTVAFKASTQEQRGNLSRASGRATDASETMLSGSKCVGAEVLLQLLKNYARRHKMKTALTVGIIGYPNVGKSSLINSLKRSKATGVSSTPGFTKAMQVGAAPLSTKVGEMSGADSCHLPPSTFPFPGNRAGPAHQASGLPRHHLRPIRRQGHLCQHVPA